jgi:serine/threonine-protein kinase HipA
MLMKRRERRAAEREGRSPRALLEMDYLMMVNDKLRPGALRFKEPGSASFLASDASRIPPLVYLPRLLAASDRILADKETDDDLRLLLTPGSSLGGARPKAAVIDSEGRLLIAKFPHGEDEYSIERWSFLALTLARKAGINVPPCRILDVEGRPILLVTRFDRQGNARIPFLSAMSMLGATDGEAHSYLELVDALRQHGANSQEDQRELWRRVLFSVLISNADDHLRNHGFLYDTVRRGWRLSPVYDLNPVPHDVKPHYLSTSIDDQDNHAAFNLVLSTGDYYQLSPGEMKPIVQQAIVAVSGWRQAAAKMGISKAETKRMASAFEHQAHDDACAYLR